MNRSSLALGALALVVACSGAPHRGDTVVAHASAVDAYPRLNRIDVSQEVEAAVSATDRSQDDRALDEGRQPGQLLTFFGVRPGARVAELFAGGGYTAELAARVVGPDGRVFAQNSAFILERFARAPLEQRLAAPHLAQVVPVERDFDAPLPPEAGDLDVVLFVLAYHDTVWMNVDRAAMNRAIFDALRPGGVYGIVDHSAASGSGTRDVETLHRIEERVIVDEVVSAGFRLEAALDVLRNPSDERDWSASPRFAGERRGTSDRFVLRFVKP